MVGGRKIRMGAGLAGMAFAAFLIAQEGPAAPKQTLSPQGLRFKRMARLKVDLEVLRKEAFKAQFGANPAVPKTSAEVRQLTQRLLMPKEGASGDPHGPECGTIELGNLYAALQNPDVPDQERENVDNTFSESKPNLPKTFTNGHFRISYTDISINTAHNTTLTKIKALAETLNGAWNDFAANFTEPKHEVWPDDRKMIEVQVYDLPAGIGGRTSSHDNVIEIDKPQILDDEFKRRTTPVHELFHRVQFSYGLVDGAGVNYATEGTAAWVQKHREPIIGDYMVRINTGLSSPDQAFLSRKYDACGFWVYAGQRAGGERRFVNSTWQRYKANGLDMEKALRDTIKAQLGSGTTLEQVIGEWSFANFMKDMSNAYSTFDYAEDELITGAGYGPLSSVPKTTKTIYKGGATAVSNGSVKAFGSDYWVYSLSGKPTKVDVSITATGTFGYGLIYYKGSQFVDYDRTVAGGNGSKSYSKTIDPNKVDRVCVMVVGIPAGGTYTINAKAR